MEIGREEKKVVNVVIKKLNSTMEKIVDTAVDRRLATGPSFMATCCLVHAWNIKVSDYLPSLGVLACLWLWGEQGSGYPCYR